MSLTLEEVNEFNELVSMVDMTELGLEDLLLVTWAYRDLINAVKPILLKHLATQNKGQTFLFKM